MVFSPRTTFFDIIHYEPEEEELELPEGKSLPHFDYYEKLRRNRFIPSVVYENSSIVGIPAHVTPLGNSKNGMTSIRLAHIASVMAVTNPIYWRIDPIWNNVQAAAVLALKHLNERSGRIIHDLPERMQACPDLFFTMDLYDSLFSPIHAARQFTGRIVNRQHSLATPLPMALSGATRSEVSETLATLAGVMGIPQVSPVSSSDSLDNKSVFPLFCRTTSSNQGMARGLAALVHNWGSDKDSSNSNLHVAILYARNTVGLSHHKHFSNAARSMGMHVFGAPYEINNPASLDKAIQSVIDSGYRYISLAPELGGFAGMAQRAYELGLGGSGQSQEYVFLLSETNMEIISAGYALPQATHYGAASLLNGSSMVLVSFPPSQDYQDAMQEDFLDNPHVMDYYIQKHPSQQLFLQEAFSFDPIHDALRNNFAGALQYSQYDVIMALGLAACQMEDPFFTGQQLFQAIKNLTFTGLTTNIKFMNETCSRDMTTLQYAAYNFVAKPVDDNGLIRFDTITNAHIHLYANTTTGKVHEVVEILAPYTYRDGTGNPPASIPPVHMEMNHVSLGVQILGWILAALVIILAVSLAGWTFLRRNTQVVKQRQPIFLWVCCMGAILMAAAIIPMSLQEPVENLDAVCMSTVWLISVGFSTAFAALSSKTWRVNTIFRHAQRFRRIQVRNRDVSLPVVVILVINLTLLCAMQVAAPLVWERVVVQNFDRYGRVQESYGTCSASSSTTQWLLGSIFFLNFAAVLLSNIQIYLSRNLPDDLSECKEVAFSMLMLLEVCLVGIPVLAVVHDVPTVRFLIASLIIFVVCLAIWVPQLPKNQKDRQRVFKASHVAKSSDATDYRTGIPSSSVRSSERNPRNGGDVSSSRTGGASRGRAGVKESNKRWQEEKEAEETENHEMIL
ncbi:acid type B receptor subunit 2 [Seminavis robusta]|uniref:Acid type B receptor subunit 2 n=1 Tax=Seminavis robusta TaxID=568900 RepID=A0A9N8HCG5_9STRA|nr:acid type B receptor subunit 2 [Seminavis robusta]|eukprot:Sro217_g089730.1 acid type B receptor subunit 2 (904) ;mRNA; f:48634-51440